MQPSGPCRLWQSMASMVRARGVTGSVAGMKPALANAILRDLVDSMGPGSGYVQRRKCAAWLRDVHGMDTSMVEAFLIALSRSPGIWAKGASYWFSKKAVFHIRHRDWRIAIGKVDVHVAHLLRDALKPAHGRRALALYTRLDTALKALEQKK